MLLCVLCLNYDYMMLDDEHDVLLYYIMHIKTLNNDVIAPEHFSDNFQLQKR